jgi:tetratricopeptide (TPR) repeat protein
LPLVGLAAAGEEAPGEVLAAADDLRLRGAYEEALALYDQALRENPASTAAWDGLAATLEAWDEDRAVAELSEARADPDVSLGAPARAILAETWARRGASEQARELLRRDPEAQEGRYYAARGRLFLADGEIPAALEDFKKAHAAGEPTAAYYLAEALSATGQETQAERYLDEFLAVFPYVAEARAARAEIYYGRGEFERAAAELASALTYDPGNPRALFDLATLAAARSDWGSAVRLYRDLVAADAGAERAYLRLAHAYEHVDPTVAAQMREEYQRRFR